MKAMFNTSSDEMLLKFHLIPSDVHWKSTHTPGRALAKGLETSSVKIFFFALKSTLERQKGQEASALSGQNLTEKSYDSVENDTILPSCDCRDRGCPTQRGPSPPDQPAKSSLFADRLRFAPAPSSHGSPPGAEPRPRAPAARGPNGNEPPRQSGEGRGAGQRRQWSPPGPTQPAAASRGRGARGPRRWGETGGRRGAVPPAPAPWLRGEAGSRLPSLFGGGGGGAAPSGPGGSRQLPHLPPPGTSRPRDAPAAHPGGRGRPRLRLARPGEAGRNRMPTAPARPEPPPQHRALAPLRNRSGHAFPGTPSPTAIWVPAALEAPADLELFLPLGSMPENVAVVVMAEGSEQGKVSVQWRSRGQNGSCLLPLQLPVTTVAAARTAPNFIHTASLAHLRPSHWAVQTQLRALIGQRPAILPLGPPLCLFRGALPHR